MEFNDVKKSIMLSDAESFGMQGGEIVLFDVLSEKSLIRVFM